MIPINNTTPIKAISSIASSKAQSSSSGFGFWSLNSTSVHSSTFSYSSTKKTIGPVAPASAPAPTPAPAPVSPVVIEKKKEVPPMKLPSPVQQQEEQEQEKRVTFESQCQVRTFEVLALDEDFEDTCEDDEEYWEQLGEDFWYQAHDFQGFKKERRSLVDRIRTIGVKNAKGNYAMEGLEFFLTLQARVVHKERVLDGWVSVLEVQADWEHSSDDSDDDQAADGGDCSQDEKVELIACKYAHVSRDCIADAHKRGVETAREIQAEDDKLVASIPKSPRPKKSSAVLGLPKSSPKPKSLGVWGNTWSTMSSSSSSSNNNNNNKNTTNGFGTFQKIRPFPRQ
ncbi:MAG: hypothetical protein SGBAC_005534 [Bacillariaceae sp.]